jgi:hypothetical protein
MPPITTGNFEDLVQLSQDTLHYLGPDLEIGNTSVGTSASLGFNNTAGDLVLVGVATGNATLNLPTGGGTLLTAFNLSAGTTSQNLSNAVFSNSNDVSFGMNGSTVTASANSLAVAAGTQTATSGTVVLSNSNGITFGMSGSTQVTAQNGGLSTWSVGEPVGSFAMSQSIISLEPFVLPVCFTMTDLVWLGSISSPAGSSGGYSGTAAIYTVTGSSISLASSMSTSVSWTSGAAYSSQSGNQYRSWTMASWAFTPGLYVLGFWLATINSASVTVFGGQSNVTLASGLAASVTQVVPGYIAATNTTLPSNVAMTNTGGWVRTGSSAFQQPWFVMQGT